MFALIIVLLTITSVLALNTEFKSHYEAVCRGSNPRKVLVHLKYLIDHLNEYKSEDDCDHSLGFHFNQEMCPKNERGTIRDLSVFFSDDDLYMYLYYRVNPEVNPSIFPAGVGRTDSWTYHLNRLSYMTESNFLFVIWIKELMNSNQTPPFFDIQYNSKNIMRQKTVKTETKIQHQELLHDLETLPSDVTISLGPTSSGFDLKSVSISDSYFITCLNYQKKRHSNCRPVERHKRISCECGDGFKPAIVFYLLGFVCLTAIAATAPFMEAMLEVEKKEKTLYVVYHNCSERTVKYRNQIILRLAKETPQSDLKHVNIDYEFFGGTNSLESVGESTLCGHENH